MKPNILKSKSSFKFYRNFELSSNYNWEDEHYEVSFKKMNDENQDELIYCKYGHISPGGKTFKRSFQLEYNQVVDLRNYLNEIIDERTNKDNDIYIAVYGPNISQKRIKSLCSSAQLVCNVKVSNYKLVFKEEINSSLPIVMVEPSSNDNDYIYTTVYKIIYSDKKLINSYESIYGYREESFQITHEGVEVRCLLINSLNHYNYSWNIIKPFDWYMKLIIEGAQEMGYPKDYIEYLNSIETIKDNTEQLLSSLYLR